jgi:hypothetical protein
MPETDAEIAAEVDLLVAAGVVDPGQRENAVNVLRARRRLRDVETRQGNVYLEAAVVQFQQAVQATCSEAAFYGDLVADLRPLKVDAQCREPLAQLEVAVSELHRFCQRLARLAADAGEATRVQDLRRNCVLAIEQLKATIRQGA